MKNINLVRAHILGYLPRLRSYVSCIDGNQRAVQRLQDPERLTRIVNYIVAELEGHDTTATPVENKSSTLRRAVAGVRGAKGE